MVSCFDLVTSFAMEKILTSKGEMPVCIDNDNPFERIEPEVLGGKLCLDFIFCCFVSILAVLISYQIKRLLDGQHEIKVNIIMRISPLILWSSFRAFEKTGIWNHQQGQRATPQQRVCVAWTLGFHQQSIPRQSGTLLLQWELSWLPG